MKLKKLINSCIKIIIIISLISNMYVNTYAVGYFQGDGQLTGAQPIVDRIYNIRSYMDTQRYFDVINEGTINGTNVWTYPYNGAACQEWKITKVAGTDEYLIQDINSGKYLSIEASSSAVGANAWIWEYDGTIGQRFKFEQYINSSGVLTPYYKILTKASNYTLALGVDTSTHNISQMNKSSAYTHILLEEASYRKGVPDGDNYIQNYFYDSFLTIETATGKAVIDDFTTTDYKCNFVYLGNSYYKIMLNNNYCLSVNYNSATVGAEVNYAQFTGTSGQLWKVVQEGDCYKFQPKCVESVDSSLYLYANGIGGSLTLDNSTYQINRSVWRRYISDEFFESFDAYLCGIQDASHGYSHVNWIGPVMTSLYERSTVTQYDQIKIGYGMNQSVQLNLFEDGLDGCSLFIFRGHGSYSPSSGSKLHFTPRNILGNAMGDDVEFSCSDLSEMDISNINSALFLCCESAHGSYSNPYSSNNFVTEARSQGVDYAIGFDNVVYCDYANEFLSLFIESYSSGESYTQAYRNALMNTEIGNNMPFFSTSSYYIYYSDGLVTVYYNN